jgi:chromosome segregation ATPase
MDPLSITASTLTVLTALETASQLIKSYCDAPGQLEALKNEISDVTATVTGVARVIEDNKDKVDTLSNNGSHLTLALSKIRGKAQELEALLRSCVTPPSSASTETKISRISWLKVKSKVQSLQAELRDGRLNLSIALATFTA